MISEELKEEIEECFDIFDKDKDGQINYVELGTLLRWLKSFKLSGRKSMTK